MAFLRWDGKEPRVSVARVCDAAYSARRSGNDSGASAFRFTCGRSLHPGPRRPRGTRSARPMWRSLRRVEATVRTPALVRGFAKKFKFTGDLGWDKLRAELLRLPVKLPELKALALTSSRIPGMRHQGARVFHLEFGAPLRYQNPDALITFRATKEPFSNIVVELASGEEHTLDVAGMQSSEIL